LKSFLEVICLLIIAIVAAGATANAVEYSGTPGKISDGDTLWVCDEIQCRHFRLCGIDAPERGQPGYEEAKTALAAIVTGRTIRCVQVGSGTVCDGRSKPTNGNRIVVQCFTDGKDVAAELVARGLACDWTKFSGGYYSVSTLGSSCPPRHRQK